MIFFVLFSNMRHDQRVTVQKMTDDNLQLSFNIIELNANFYRYQFYLNVSRVLRNNMDMCFEYLTNSCLNNWKRNMQCIPLMPNNGKER